jgi:hypothetical protein
MKLLSNKKTALSLGLAGVALGSVATTAFAAGAKVCFEAESAVSISSPLRKASAGSGYSGHGYIEIPWDRNKSKGIGSATYRIRVARGGVYYLWARTFWANGCGNSIGVSVNNSGDKILGEDGTYEKWHWVGGNAKVSLKPGVNTIVLKNRETGIRVDEFYLSQDPYYIPQGARKANA